MNGPDTAQEIIIIKRDREGEHGHHGGAWKIAFADFMTALMALFLVLWLINAADEETKKAVASYFNPVKLVERNRTEKGVHDSQGVQDEEPENPNGKFPESMPSEDAPQQEITDAELFSDPFAVLDVIASNDEPKDVQNKQEGGGREGNDAINDAAGGEAFMDPFSPNFWNEEIRNSNDSGQLTGIYESEGHSEDADGQMAAAPGGGDGEGIERPADENDVEGTAAQARGIDHPRIPEGIVEDAIDETGKEDERATAVQDAASELRRKITAELNAAFGEDSEIVKELAVTAQGDDVMISLTDSLDISMYEIGSAVPSPELVTALEKVGAVLAEQEGGVRIQGHTDARPFRSGGYDNWRLSAARAQSAYYMLLRGGLEETRVREISGFADRELLDAEDPFSYRNRRIEVLVEVPAE
ncbi:MotB family protein [Oricola thermophila]|uniref:MotB family protein n=1 Tax=Oricola thermophila TaxID=2742145 RepID=A0A6N1VFD3_9HYPH|nr:MotB family protein [Oricola thermophila]QKV19631.1 MotB family protein [Oricola thermophila]